MFYTYPSKSKSSLTLDVNSSLDIDDWRPFGWVFLYVGTSALLVRSWNTLWLDNSWFLVYIEIIITCVVLVGVSLYLLPKIERISLSEIKWTNLPSNKQLAEVALLTGLIVVVFIYPSFII